MDAIIFDCDGTLADTMPVHYEAWQETMFDYGLFLSEDRFYALGGWPTLVLAEMLVREGGSSADPRQIAHEKEAAFQRRLQSVRPIEPVVRVVRQHRGQLPIAVATGAIRPILDEILAHIGLADAFNALVSSEEVPHHKPAPDIFLEAARRLGVEPGGCLVYEDTDPGIEAARRAGMAYVDVRTLHMPRRVTGPDRRPA
ncbi:MAG TPA: beta-phosphoglucomutase family hydrolase [Pirellulales bacterium]|nr:beta-phosphoglucomutase family hydrolase [Pirellulales bacterium]